jgi:hypothetical protein
MTAGKNRHPVIYRQTKEAIMLRKRKAQTTQNAAPGIYGLLASFETPEALVAAARRVRDAGFTRFDAYAPYPVEGLSDAMKMRASLLPLVMLVGGISGALIAFFGMAFATVIDYPLNIGGRPLFSWPAYIPITFELTILFAAFGGILGLFAMTRFPQPYHPVFRSEEFNEHASQDGFFLGIEASDPKYNLDAARRLLQDAGAVTVSELEA